MGRAKAKTMAAFTRQRSSSLAQPRATVATVSAPHRVAGGE